MSTRLIDLTIPFSEETVTVPGHPSPRFELRRILERDGLRSTHVSMMLHCGTHIDAPYHRIQDGATIDQIPLDRFRRPARKIDLTDRARPGQEITVADLMHGGFDAAASTGAILVLATGWADQNWRSPRLYAENPHLSAAAATALAEARPSALALDFSVDAGPPWPMHEILLGADVLLIENLLGLPALPSDGFTIIAFPLRLVGENGSPARVVAEVPTS